MENKPIIEELLELVGVGPYLSLVVTPYSASFSYIACKAKENIPTIDATAAIEACKAAGISQARFTFDKDVELDATLIQQVAQLLTSPPEGKVVTKL